jgi:hypothetical protein
MPKFFIIDDGFGTIDSTHIKNVASFLQSVSSKFKWLLIMGHREEIMAYCDIHIAISSIDEVSNIIFGDEIKTKSMTDFKEEIKESKKEKSLTDIIQSSMLLSDIFKKRDSGLYCTICKKQFKLSTESFKTKHVKSISHIKNSKIKDSD